MRGYMMGMALVLTTAPGTAQAQGVPQGTARASHAAILAGDMAGAERALVAERRIHPDRTEYALNLAAIYAQTGRTREADALYRDVLARGDVTMDLSADRTASAHAIARTGLARIARTQTASR